MRKIDLFNDAAVISKNELRLLRGGDSFSEDTGEDSHKLDIDGDSYSNDHNGDSYSNDSGTGVSVRLDYRGEI